MRRLVILPVARADLIEIGDYIAHDDPARAASFIAELEALLRRAAENPQMYPARDDLHAGLRAARHGRYLAFFMADENELRVVRILHGARDLRRLMGS